MKRFLTLFLAFSLLLSAVPMMLTVSAEDNVVASGDVNDDVQWNITGTSGDYTLTVSLKEGKTSGAVVSDSTVTVDNNNTGSRYKTAKATNGYYYVQSPWGKYEDGWADGITTLVVEEGITATVGNSFAMLRSLKNVSLPSTLKYLGYKTFSGDTSLVAIELPEGLSRVHTNVFEGCSSLEYVKIPSTLDLFAYKWGSNAFATQNQAKELFKNCKKLQYIYLHSNRAAELGNQTNVLTELSLFNNTDVTIICEEGSMAETYAKANNLNCKSYANIADAGLMYNEDNTDPAMYGNSNVNPRTVYYVKTRNEKANETESDTYSVTILGSGPMLSSAKSKTRVKPFMTNTGTALAPVDNTITSVIVENGITSIGKYAFMGLTAMTSFTCNIQTWKSSFSVLNETGGWDTYYPFDAYAFQNCKSLQEITIPDGIEIIRNGAFMGCGALETVNIPASVTEIGAQAFSGTGLKTVIVPDTVTKVGNQAFENSGSLLAVYIPSTVSVGTDPVKNCDLNPTVYRSMDDVQALVSVNAFSYYTGTADTNQKSGIRALLTADEGKLALLERMGYTVEYGFLAAGAATAEASEDFAALLNAGKTVQAAVYLNRVRSTTYTGDMGDTDVSGKHPYLVVLYNIDEAAEYVLTGYVRLTAQDGTETILQGTDATQTKYTVGDTAYIGASVTELKSHN